MQVDTSQEMLLQSVEFPVMRPRHFGFHADWQCGTLATATQRSALVVSWFVLATYVNCGFSSGSMV